jgi:hypothetical protein
VARVLAFVLSWAAVPVILYGVLFGGAAGVEAYNVAFRGAQVGAEVIPGHPAVPLGVSLIQVGIGVAIIAVGVLARMYARRLRVANA